VMPIRRLTGLAEPPPEKEIRRADRRPPQGWIGRGRFGGLKRTSLAPDLRAADVNWGVSIGRLTPSV